MTLRIIQERDSSASTIAGNSSARCNDNRAPAIIVALGEIVDPP